jgi:hypothetical protein
LTSGPSALHSLPEFGVGRDRDSQIFCSDILEEHAGVIEILRGQTVIEFGAASPSDAEKLFAAALHRAARAVRFPD